MNPDHMQLVPQDPVERFWSYVDRDGDEGCWIWRPKEFLFRVNGEAHVPRRYAYGLERELVEKILTTKCGNNKCVRPSHAATARDRFFQRIDKNADGCWYWLGETLPGGYPHLTYDGVSVYANRLSYQWFNGPLDDTLVVTQSCGHRTCVNPEHLEQITHHEMAMRREAKRRARKEEMLDNSGNIGL